MKVNDTLSYRDDAWTGSPTSKSHRWQSSQTLGGTYADIPGATGATYLIGNTDAEKFIRLGLTASNATGPSPEVFSAAVGPVEGVVQPAQPAPLAAFAPSLSVYNSASGVAPDLILDFDAGVYARRVNGTLTTVALSDIVTGATLVTGPDGIRRLRTEVGDIATASLSGYNLATGSVVARFSQPKTVGGFERIWQIDAGTEADRIAFWLQSGGRYWLNVQSGGGTSQVGASSGPLIGPIAARSASTWATNNCANSVDGAAVTLDTLATMPAVPPIVLRFGHQVNGTAQPGGGIERLVLFTSRLSDADLAAASANALRYVSPTGSNAATGTTEATAWATPAHAAANAPAGSTVYVKAGTYNPFKINVSGTEGAYTTFCAYPGAEKMAIVDGGSIVNTSRFDGQADRTTAGWTIGDTTGTSSPWLGGIRIHGQSWIRIAGWHIRNLSSQNQYGKKPSGVEIYASELVAANTIRNIRVMNNKITNTRACAVIVGGQRYDLQPAMVATRVADVIIENNDCSLNVMIDPWHISGHNEAISIGGGTMDVIVRNNLVYETPAYGIDFKAGLDRGEIVGNTIYDVENHAIYIDTGKAYVRNVKIHRNRCYNANTGVTIARETATQSHEIDAIDVYNNLIYNITQYGVLIYKHIADMNDATWGVFRDVKLRHNTVHNCGINGIRIIGLDQIATGFICANNIVVNNTKSDINYAAPAPPITKAANLTNDAMGEVIGGPLFVSVTSGAEDFHLQAGSPAIDVASATYATATDFAGVARSVPDIGAYERI